MGSEAVARALDLHDNRVVQQAIKQRGGDDRVAEHIAPFREAPVRRQDHRALFVAMIDELEEQVGAPRGDRQVADFIDDQQAVAAEEAQFLRQPPISFGPAESFDDFGQGGAIDALASPDGLDVSTQRNLHRLSR